MAEDTVKITVVEDADTGEVVQVHGPDCVVTEAVTHVVENLGLDINSSEGRAAAVEYLQGCHDVQRGTKRVWGGWGPGHWGQKPGTRTLQ